MSSNSSCDYSAGSPTIDASSGSTGPQIGEEDFFRVAGFLAVTVTVLSMGIALQTFKRRWLFLQDTSVAVILGTLIGVIIQFSNKRLTEAIVISPSLFYNVILPPIIFEGGLQIDRHLFKRNFPAIALLALPGIAFGIFASGGILYGLLGPSRISFLDSLTFMAALGATDPVSVLSTFQAVPVEPDVSEVIFGESALNDATGIIMFRLMKSFSAPGTVIDGATVGVAIGQVLLVFILAILVGIVFGVVTSLLLKHLDFGERGAVYETSVVLGIAYAAFLFSELFHLSGIISLTFCGIFVRQHVVPNLTREGYKMTSQTLRAFAGFMETMLFCYLGFSLGGLSNDERTMDAAWIFATEFAILVSRGAVVALSIPLSNLFRNRASRFGWKQCTFMWFAGLRGGVAFLLALELAEGSNFSLSYRKLTLGTTLMVIMFSVILFGGATARMIKILDLGFKPVNQKVAAALDVVKAQTLVERPGTRNPFKDLYRLQDTFKVLGMGGTKTPSATETPSSIAIPSPSSDVAPVEAPKPLLMGTMDTVGTDLTSSPSPATVAPHNFKYATGSLPVVGKAKWTAEWSRLEDRWLKPVLWRKDALEEAKVKTSIGYKDPDEGEGH